MAVQAGEERSRWTGRHQYSPANNKAWMHSHRPTEERDGHHDGPPRGMRAHRFRRRPIWPLLQLVWAGTEQQRQAGTTATRYATWSTPNRHSASKANLNEPPGVH